MGDWTFVLIPLLVLPIVLLFRFVGCGENLPPAPEGPPPPPPYRDFIMSDATNVIGYWRLVDPQKESTAKDENEFQDGTYVSVPGGLLPEEETVPGAGNASEGAPGTFDAEPSLIASDPRKECRLFNGGYVTVPFKDGLWTEEFTIEAWIDAEWGANITGHAHTLFAVGGRYTRPLDTSPAFHGFSVFADGQNRWQVVLLPIPGPVFSSPPGVPRSGRTHVAVSVQDDPQGKRVRMFVNGKETAAAGGGTGGATVASYSLPKGAPLFIGVANRTADPAAAPVVHRPIVSMVQEVVLHNKALSPEEIENHVDINRSE